MTVVRVRVVAWLFVVVAMAQAGAGCRTRSYVVAVQNHSGVELDEVVLTYGAVEFRMGALVPDGRATWVGATSLPEDGSLSWKTMGGKQHRATFFIASQLPKDLDDLRSEVWITIEADDNVTVSPKARPHARKDALP